MLLLLHTLLYRSSCTAAHQKQTHQMKKTKQDSIDSILTLPIENSLISWKLVLKLSLSLSPIQLLRINQSRRSNLCRSSYLSDTTKEPANLTIYTKLSFIPWPSRKEKTWRSSDTVRGKPVFQKKSDPTLKLAENDSISGPKGVSQSTNHLLDLLSHYSRLYLAWLAAYLNGLNMHLS